MDPAMMGACGSYCDTCEWKEKTGCPGCVACKGKPFWGNCAIAACSIEKGHAHCGHCGTLPCPNLQAAFDSKEHGDHGERLINLRNWAKGDFTYLRLRTLPKEEK